MSNYLDPTTLFFTALSLVVVVNIIMIAVLIKIWSGIDSLFKGQIKVSPKIAPPKRKPSRRKTERKPEEKKEEEDYGEWWQKGKKRWWQR